MHVLLLEDNARLAALFVEGLRREGFVTHAVGTLADAEAAVASTSYDAVVVDRGLPDGDGLDLVRRLRHEPGAPPVLVLTARGEVREVCEGLDLGADDYMVKPISLRELVSRLNVARRRGGRAAPMLTLGRLELDQVSRAMTLGGQAFDLPNRERTLLEALLRAAPRPVTKEALEGRLASLNRTVQPNAVEVYVHRLRSRLAEAKAGLTIRTVRGLGYRLEVAEAEEGAAP
ncbi:response regulator transcription factor [Acetobacteraceae bacterium H6797]|nr:response regulator transcription factor [Acetobacteraceae bacterium H6797]